VADWNEQAVRTRSLDNGPRIKKLGASRQDWSYSRTIRFLEPQGIRTGDIESLTGVVARLAQRHWMTPALFARLAVGHFEASRDAPAKSAFARRYSQAYNGISEIGLRTARALEKATGSDLYRRTCLHAWYGAVARQQSGLQKPQLAWCMECIQGDASPYHRLLWTVRDVEFCPWHGTRLSTTCPSCGASQLPMSRLPSWYHCDSCHADMRVERRSNELTLTNSRPGEWDMWIARSSSKLIERTCAAGYSLPHGLWYSRLAPICDYLEPAGGDDMAARHLGVRKSLIRDWRRGRSYPSPGALWFVSYRLGVPPDVLLLDGDQLLESLTWTSGQFRDDTNCVTISRNDYNLMQERLEELVCRPLEQVPSISAAAGMLVITEKRLRQKFPELTETLKRRSKERCKIERVQRRVRRVQEVLQICLHLRSIGVYPSERKVRQHASVLPSDLRRDNVRAVLHAQQLVSKRAGAGDRGWISGAR